MKYIIGTRGSSLAFTQTSWVQSQLQANFPAHTFVIKIIQTKGDQNQKQALYQMPDKGIFVKEIEEALLRKEIDIAVHSMKDMPTALDKRLIFSKTMKREDPRDVFISYQYASLDELPKGAVIATGSLRRKAQLKAYRSDLQLVDIRGNIDTRIQKMKDQMLDGIILAAAGMHRMHLEANICQYLSEDIMIPACAQGALAIELRNDDMQLYAMLQKLGNENAHREVIMERTFLEAINGGCHVPVGAHCTIYGQHITFVAVYGNTQLTHMERYVYEGPYDLHQAEIAASTLKQKIEVS